MTMSHNSISSNKENIIINNNNNKLINKINKKGHMSVQVVSLHILVYFYYYFWDFFKCFLL